jgi:hypothetical protein
MELSKTPDIYEPLLGEDGKYIDCSPNFTTRNGLRCVCGTKTIFTNKASFAQHCKTALHQTWLSLLNSSRVNYYIENQRLEETVKNQQVIIAKLTRDNEASMRTINTLTGLLAKASSRESEDSHEKMAID